jgi:hypothetical protein
MEIVAAAAVQMEESGWQTARSVGFHIVRSSFEMRKRKPSPDFSDEGLVDFSLSDYFLQHSLGQHFALPLQQSAAGDVAVAVLMNAAKVAIIRRYFIRSFC